MTRRAIQRAVAIVSVVGAACSDSVEPTLPEFSATPSSQWSGGAITLRSSYFVHRDPLPIITAGSDTLAVTRQDDSTVITTLPRGPSGPLTFALTTRNRSFTVASVQRVGFSEKTTLQVGLDGELLATDSAGVPFVLGGYPNGTGIREAVVRVEFSPIIAGQVIPQLKQPSNAVYGMAPSSTPVYTVRDGTDSLRLATLLDDLPLVTGTVPWVGTGFTRQVSRLSPGMWLFTGSHQTYTRRESDSLQVTIVQAESPWAVYMSPRGDRTTLATTVPAVSGNGVPVFDNLTGTVAYVLPFRTTEVAAFSPDGSTLYAAGGYFSSDTLVAVNATTGSLMLPKVPLPEGFNAMGLAYRTGGGGQLLIGAANLSSLALLVYDANTLALLGILPTGESCGANPQTGPCFMGVVSVDNAHNAAYIVIPGSPAPIWAFDLLSTP